jgi:hypothetical protein
LDPTETVTETKFEDLVGEGKKYRDNDAVAKAIAEKDRFIERLKAEAAEAREAALKRANEKEFLDRLETLSRGKSPEPGNQPPTEGTQTTAVTPETIEQMLEAREAKKAREANLNTAISKLQETFGDDYKRHVQRQAQSLNTTTTELTELASKSPAAFLRLMGVDGQQNKSDAFSPPPRSSVSVQPGSVSNVKDYNYYAKLRQEKGESWYFSLPVQKEIWEQSKALGDSFLPKQH